MKKSYRVNKPNKFFYGLFRFLSLLLSKFVYNLKIKRNEIKNKKGPFLIVANHESFIDFINLCTCNNHRMHFVVSNSFYQSLFINPILKQVGVIPKQQFQTTPEDLKKMKTVIDDKMPLVIYPAGLMCEDGVSTPIPKATAKLIKWFNCDVYVAKIKGSYFTKPKWGKGIRKGKITLDVYKLYEKDNIKSLSEEKVLTDLDEHLSYNCYKYQEEDKVVYKKHNNIFGLENVLYKCPKCNEEFSMVTNKNKLICKHCNNVAISDKYGFLHKEKSSDIIYRHVSDWAKFIKESTYELLINNENYQLKDHVKVSMIDYKNHKFVEVGEVDLTYKRSAFSLKGIINGKPFEKEISTYEMFILPFSPGKYFEIQDNKDIYRIHLSDPRKTTKWIYFLRAVYLYNHKGVVLHEV